ncbi:N-6 DNA methylase [Permianibacter sp. IMCC34836]|uniref:type I restriction-modification system subunit M n=1 Tax=Permianibacter fluminis TaxID=2738515 RepID=UPI0015548178|nr:type I restriction-modification system subunit M [Permianibacter fluminis]NQD35979.1 N-6 DNA methylase [Permianibacter fluminis]
MFEQAFRNIDDALWKESGCTTELDYTEQTSWLLFLKYLDGLEQDKANEAALEGKPYRYILDEDYRWQRWAAPKGADGKLDHNIALTGDDLVEFVDRKLFPYLHGIKLRASGPNTIEYKIGEIFGEIKNKIRSGYTLRDIIDHIDELRFRSQTEKHELSMLYEEKIKRMGNAGRNGGEYYTPRPLIRAMIQVVQPKIGERIYDGACGSAGFLCEAYDFLTTVRSRVEHGTGSEPVEGQATRTLSTSDLKTLQEKTFYGKEKKSLAYVIAIMNMILHGIEAPNIQHTNTLAENLADIQDKDRMDVILANPPFGGKERAEVQQNFPIRTGETAFLFLQHFIKMLKAGGRAAIVIKNTFLSNSDNASVSLRKLLLESCNLHTVLDCPGGTFQGAGVKTVVLFFEKGAPTRKVWYYQLDPGRNMGKTNPLNDSDLSEFIALQKTFADSAKSWSLDVSAIDTATYDLSVKNPSGGEEVKHRSPQDILDEIAALDVESAVVLATIRAMV